MKSAEAADWKLVTDSILLDYLILTFGSLFEVSPCLDSTVIVKNIIQIEMFFFGRVEVVQR